MSEQRRTLVDLAAETGCTPRTIRHYIAKGLLPPAPRRDRLCSYTDEHVVRLRLLLAAKAKNKTLTDLRLEIQATYPWAFPSPHVSTINEAA